MNHYSEHLGSILLIVISLNAVVNDIFMKYLLIDGFNSLTVQGLRIFFSFIWAIIIYSFNLGYYISPSLSTDHPNEIHHKFCLFTFIKELLGWRHIVRNFITILALITVIEGLKTCQIAQVDLITYLIPAFISLISTFFFQEKFNWINFSLVNFCIGTFIFRKGLSNTLPLIMAALLFSLAEVWIKHKMSKDNIWKMILSMGLMGSIGLSYFFIPILFKLTLWQLLLSILLGMGDISILSFITLKSRVGSSHDYLPLRYTSVIFAVLADKLVFKTHNIDWIMIGVVIICSVITIYYGSKKNKLLIN